MAKKTNDELYQTFLADVLATVPTELRGDAEKVLRADSVAAKMKDSVLARADYSRTMDEGRNELAAARAAFDNDVAEARTRISGWESWYSTASQEVAEATKKAKQYESKFGPLDDSNNHSNKSFLSEDDFQKRLKDELSAHDAAAIAFANDLTKVQVQYLKDFKDLLDTDSLIADATKRGITLKAAYAEFVAPKVKEREKQQFDDAIKAAKEEGAREHASTHRLPFVSGPAEPHVLDSMSRTETARTPDSRVAAAVKGWAESQSQNRS